MSESTLTGQPVPTESEDPIVPQVPQERTNRGVSTLRRISALLGARAMVPFWFGVILIIGGFFRFTGVDWDEGHHLHPDERFLSQVVNNIQWPQQDFLKNYFDEATSTLNPRNMGHTFYVYGDFPITFTKGVAVALDKFFPLENGASWQGYDTNYKLGRVLDGIMDMGTIVMLFFLGLRLYKDHRIALLAATFYAGSALAIQQSHFFVVDSFTAFFVTIALFFMVRLAQEGKLIDYVLSGAFVGISLATKLSIFTLAGIVAIVGVYRFFIERKELGNAAALERTFFRLVLSGIAAIAMFRIFQPTAFSGPFTIAERWWQNAQEARGWVTGERDAPFAHQWTDRTPLLFPLQNMVMWGLGVPLGIAAWVGWGSALLRMIRSNRWVHLVPVAWVGILFLHQGTQWVKSMRYFLPIYPALALLAAWLLVRMLDGARRTAPFTGENKIPGRVWFTGGLLVTVTAATLIYAFGFTQIYTRPHTRIAASEWIYDNVPQGSIIANETVWDDGLPLSRPNRPSPFGTGGYLVSQIPLVGVDMSTIPADQQSTYLKDSTLNITDEDEEGKWYGRPDPTGYTQPGIFDKLDAIDYYFISSNRQYDSMSRLPMRFPAVINFYDALFSGELGFEKVAEFTSYPSFLGIPLPDQGAEEAWHVYDHNRVQIWRKTDAYSREKAEQLILGDVDFSEVRQLLPIEVAGWKGDLKLTAQESVQYQAGGTWSQIFDRDGIVNRIPLLVWIIALQLFGLVALPYLRVAASGLPTKGYFFAKALGLLMVTWVVWILASFHWVPFSALSVLLGVAIVALGGVALLWWEARHTARSVPTLLREWWAKDMRHLLLAEAVFWGFFALVLAVRFANPDLWHQDLGGEKPMDFAFLNATIKSSYFPPMDPWFGGGYINYYYYGFIIAAVITKFTGVMPSIAYNLIVPMFFAMLAAGVFGVAIALQVPLKATEEGPVTITRRMIAFALCAALFVGVLGNLGEVKVLSDNLYQLSDLNFTSGIPGLEKTVKSVDGLVRGMLLKGQAMPGRMEWPYWNPTRVITSNSVPPITEFPWFTFLYADLHAHMMALPFTVLAIGLALAFLRTNKRDTWLAEVLRLGLMSLVLGALWPINTWDFPTYVLVAFAGLGLREWRRDGAITMRGLIAVVWRMGIIVVLSRLLFQPFFTRYGAAYSSVEQWKGDRTDLSEFFIIHGMFLLAIVFALLNDFAYGKGHNGIVRLARFTMNNVGKRARARHLYNTLVQNRFVLPLSSFYPIIFAVLLVVAAGIMIGWGVPVLTLVLLAFTMLLFFRQRPQPLWQMVLFFIMLGFGLTCAVELVVLKGDIERMNTVFKFYLQVWVLWGIAAALGIATVFPRLPQWLPEWRFVYRWSLGILIFVCTLYPIFATNAKIRDRFDVSVGSGLDGAAFMEKAIIRIATPDDMGSQQVQFDAKWDADAMRWIQDNIPGSPIMAEMNTAPKALYGWGNRYAMFTGNPSIIGWDHHERQQRASARSDQEINDRVTMVRESIYRTPDAALAYETLMKFDASYIIVGPLEVAYANPEGIAKFDANRGTYWDLVYENEQVKIYRVIYPDGETALK